MKERQTMNNIKKEDISKRKNGRKEGYVGVDISKREGNWNKECKH